jgi:hypothetical protein
MIACLWNPRESFLGLSMLAARRDPPLHVDARDAVSPHFEGNPAVKAPKAPRFVTVVQMMASLLAVPVGIGSAYTFYRANFSPEITCQSLRSSIIAMLDRGIDASTRRMLVRRDVEAFEKACAAVDPDATAAFKTLLTVEKPAPPVAAATPAPKAQPNNAAKEPVKAEPRPPAAQKQAVATPASPGQNVRKEPVSDTQWLEAVREALTTHEKESRPADSAKIRTVSPPTVRPVPREPGPPAAVSSPGTPAAASALPPPVAVAPPPAQQNDAARTQDSDHPVPPESIPDAAQFAAAAEKADEDRRSKIEKWISAIPLLGPVVDNARH